MLIPHKCPVCEGSGQTPGTLGPGTLTGPITCHACGGTGIIWGKGPDQPVKPPWGPRYPWPYRWPYEVDPFAPLYPRTPSTAGPVPGEFTVCFG